MTTAGTNAELNSSCHRCGAAFRCGMVGGDNECWCVKLPHLMRVPASSASTTNTGTTGASCFCPACLKKITDDRPHNTLPA
ncbi:MAG: cysteine-rich CWC family protein [Polaromonas sp.]|uniref:cysteine-rich CWC family protein n=1 Tax=Polaromonas sp. TaxID=1869339 RepID=UPI0027348954|nr:cysteine-rich CWC family protein [Polaromonas sp.]MDP2819100.1 cysteine-rich CWC family protein [Polaromonas sp.]